jgi:hypothetical protein
VPILRYYSSIAQPTTLAGSAADTNLALRANVTGDAADRWSVRTDGRQLWGDGTAALDVNLYRGAANQLKTDDDFVAVGNLTAANFPSGAWTGSWTPVWSTTSGLHTPSFGNATIDSRWTKVGRLLFFSFGVLFGSSTNFGSGATVADNWTFSLPGSQAAGANFSGSQLICGFGKATFSALAVVPFSVRVDSGGTNFLLDIAGGRADGTAVTNSGAVDAVSPWAWANGCQLQFSGVVETMS